MFVNTKQRSSQSEIMDDLTLEGDLLRKTLGQLELINRWLGGHRPTVQAVKKMIRKLPDNQEITIVDVGCGGGDLLRVLAEFGRKNHRKFKLIGIDANAFTVNYARQMSQNYSEIDYFTQNVFSAEFSELDYDLILLNLFLHHFKDEEILELIALMTQKARLGIVVNDLQRSELTYHLFRLVCLLISNPMARDDGLTSILRGFKKEDLVRYSKKLNLKNYVVKWKWAFRYLWIIEKQNP